MTAYKLSKGDRVQGVYYGNRFSGIVRETRFHSCRHDLLEVKVDLDSPITVYGDPRNSVIVSCDGETGQEVKGWEGSYLI